MTAARPNGTALDGRSMRPSCRAGRGCEGARCEACGRMDQTCHVSVSVLVPRGSTSAVPGSVNAERPRRRPLSAPPAAVYCCWLLAGPFAGLVAARNTCSCSAYYPPTTYPPRRLTSPHHRDHILSLSALSALALRRPLSPLCFSPRNFGALPWYHVPDLSRLVPVLLAPQAPPLRRAELECQPRLAHDPQRAFARPPPPTAYRRPLSAARYPHVYSR